MPSRWTIVLLSALVLCAGCRGPNISVVGRGTQLVASDGFLLTVMSFDERAREDCQPKAVVVYVQGSEDRSVTESIGALAGFCGMGARVIAVERRGVRPDAPADREAAATYCTREVRIADNAAALDWAARAVPASTPVILVGASEGADVAGAVAAASPRVSRLILLGGGGGWTQEEELRHFVRTNGSYLGIASEADLDAKLADIRAHPDSGEQWLGHPYRRWATFMFARPADDLLKVDCPILLMHGDADQAVPVESARALRDAFAAARKSNLTYSEIPGADHRFTDPVSGENKRPLVELEVVRFLSGGGLLTPLEASLYETRVRRAHPELFAKRH